MIEKFKNRYLDSYLPVKLYRNLHKKGRWYSLKQGCLVRAHTNGGLILRDCKFVVQQSGWKRYKQTGVRNVHAFVKGYLTSEPKLSFGFLLEYNKEEGLFYCRLGQETFTITKATCIYVQDGLIYCQL